MFLAYGEQMYMFRYRYSGAAVCFPCLTARGGPCKGKSRKLKECLLASLSWLLPAPHVRIICKKKIIHKPNSLYAMNS